MPWANGLGVFLGIFEIYVTFRYIATHEGFQARHKWQSQAGHPATLWVQVQTPLFLLHARNMQNKKYKKHIPVF